MENASKAFIIAGATLIAVMLISMFMWFFNTLKGYNASSSSSTRDLEIESFNRYFLYIAPKDSDISGIDALNIYNKLIDLREAYDVETISLVGSFEIGGYTFTNDTTSSDYYNNIRSITNNLDVISNISRAVYGYNYSYDSDGRVSTITLQKK